MYNPTISIAHVLGNIYDINTEVEIPNDTDLALESNTVTGDTREIIYRVVGDEEDGSYTAEAIERIVRQEDETTVKVVIKKDGTIKGSTSRSYD